ILDTPSGSSPTRPRVRRSSRVKAVPRFRIGVASTEVPRARTRTAGPSGVVANSYGRSVMWPSLPGLGTSLAERRRWGRSRHLYPERPDVSELADADGGQLAPVAAALDAPERQPRVGGDDAVDEQRAGLYLPPQPPAPLEVAGPDAGPQPVGGVVGQLDGLLLVLGPDHGRHRAEGLLLEHRHLAADAGEDGRGEEPPPALQPVASQQRPCPLGQRLGDL